MPPVRSVAVSGRVVFSETAVHLTVALHLGGGGATADEIRVLGIYVIRDLAAAIVRSGARLRP